MGFHQTYVLLDNSTHYPCLNKKQMLKKEFYKYWHNPHVNFFITWDLGMQIYWTYKLFGIKISGHSFSSSILLSIPALLLVYFN